MTVAPSPSPAPTGLSPATVQDNWLIDAVLRHLRAINPLPIEVLDIGNHPTGRIRAEDLGAEIEVTSVVDDGSGELGEIDDDQVDVAVSLGVLATIGDDDARHRAVRELVRVAPLAIVVDVDWSAVEGGPAFNRLRDMVSTTMVRRGVNLYYGLLQHCEVSLAAYGLATVTSERTPVDTIVPSRSVVEVAERALEGLTGLDRHRADELLTATSRELAAGVPHCPPEVVVSHIVRATDDDGSAMLGIA